MTVGGTERTRVRRIPDNAKTDEASLYAVLDASKVAHVGIAVDSQPFVLPVAYARDNDVVYFHGSTASRLFRSLQDGASCCFTVTVLDGLVLARSAFESSMNYRSAMVLGVPTVLTDAAELHALERISEHLMPGRWADIRPPAAKELAATLTLQLALDECSVKIRTGGPNDVPEDLTTPPWSQAWAGHVPLHATYGQPIPDDLAAAIAVPTYVHQWD